MQQPEHRNIYREKVTGARAGRRELNRMLGKLAPGEVVTVTRIDRLARSTFDLFGIVKRIVDAKAQFRSLAELWADSTSGTGGLMLAVTQGPRRRGARSYPHPDSRGQEPRQGSEKSHGPPPSLTPDPGATERGHQRARAGRDARRTRSRLQRRPSDDFTIGYVTALRDTAFAGCPSG
jgi:hypothetical protein